MTELRDVRFQQALEAAPDAHMAPDARTRLAIQNMAAEAVKPKPAAAAPVPAAWWRRLWGSGSGRMPWNAAFATVLLAGFVTLLWHDKPVPDAQLDEAPVKASREARPAVPAPAPAAAPTPAPAPAQDSRSEPPPSAPGRGGGVMQAPSTDAASTPSGQRQQPQQGTANEARKQAPVRERETPLGTPPRAANPTDANLATPRPAPVAPSSPAAPEVADPRSIAPSARGRAETTQEPVPVSPPPPPVPSAPVAAAPMAPPAPAPAAAPPPAAFPQSAPPAPAPAIAAAAPKAAAEQGPRADAASAPPMRAAPGLAAGGAFSRAAPAASPDSPALEGWDALRITQGGQTWRVPRAQAAALAAQARRVAPTASGDSLPGTVSLRIEFMQGDEPLAVLELGEEPWVRWTLLRPGFAGRWVAQADRGQLMSLQLALQRLGVGAR